MTRQEFREKREGLGLSRGQLAEQTGYTSRTIQALESGDKPILKRHEIALSNAKPPKVSRLQKNRSPERIAEIDEFIIDYIGILENEIIAEKLREPVKYISERISTLRSRGKL